MSMGREEPNRKLVWDCWWMRKTAALGYPFHDEILAKMARAVVSGPPRTIKRKKKI